MSPALLPPLLALTVTTLALGIFERLSLGPLDHPNHRSLHHRPTPRIGGLGMATGVVVALGYVRLGDWHNVLVVAFALCALSLADDYLHVPAGLRFLAHAAAAALFLYASPWAVCMPIRSTSARSSGPSRSIRCCSDCPEMYCITMNGNP